VSRACSDDHDYGEELIQGSGGWYHGPLGS
jgi:hypothetical protein